MANQSKNRYWAFVYYPSEGNLIYDLVNHLNETKLKWVMSPVHDSDINPDGKKKKTHVHVMLCWDGPTTYKRACEVAGELAANGHLESVLSARGMYRYLTHADNPEKHQYREEDIRSGNGFNPAELMTETDKKILLKKCCEIIEENKIKSIRKMSNYLIKERLLAEWSVFSSNANFFRGYFSSWYDDEPIIGKQLTKDKF